MNKKLRSCVEAKTEKVAPLCLVDMNRVEMLESAGFFMDLVHKKSAHVSGGWNLFEQSEIGIPMGKSNLTGYTDVTFSAFSDHAKDCKFRISFLCGDEEGHAVTLTVPKNGWCRFRVRLPFAECLNRPCSWNEIESIRLDSAELPNRQSGVPILYFDNLFIWKEGIPREYEIAQELRHAALFSLNGRFAVINGKRVSNGLNKADVRPFSEDGEYWLPLIPFAAVLGAKATADTETGAVSFLYRKQTFVFSPTPDYLTVDGDAVDLGGEPKCVDGVLFLPATFLSGFFKYPKVTVFGGCIQLSLTRGAFQKGRDERLVDSLISDLCAVRPNEEKLVENLQKRYPAGSRGKLIYTYDQLNQMRSAFKEDEFFTSVLKRLKKEYGSRSPRFASGEKNLDSMMGFAILFRLTADRKYCERAMADALAVAEEEDWKLSDGQAFGKRLLALSLVYDFCKQALGEAEKARLERAVLRRGIREGLAGYFGDGYVWRAGADGLFADMGLLSAGVAFSDVYPESTKKILRVVLAHAEVNAKASSFDGGALEALLYMSIILRNLFGDDFGIFSMSGLCKDELPMDFGSENFFLLANVTEEDLFFQIRKDELAEGSEKFSPLEILFC